MTMTRAIRSMVSAAAFLTGAACLADPEGATTRVEALLRTRALHNTELRDPATRDALDKAIEEVSALGPEAIAPLCAYLRMSTEERATVYADPGRDDPCSVDPAAPCLTRLLGRHPAARTAILAEMLANAPPYTQLARIAIECASGAEEELMLARFWNGLGDRMDAESVELLAGKHIAATIPTLIEQIDRDDLGDRAAEALVYLTGRSEGFEEVPQQNWSTSRHTGGFKIKQVRLSNATRADPAPVQASWRAWFESVHGRLRWDPEAKTLPEVWLSCGWAIQERRGRFVWE